MVDYTRTVSPGDDRPPKSQEQVPAKTGEETSVDDFFNSEYSELPETSALNAENLDVDIEETKEAYLIEAELEGFSADEINIEVQGNYLRINATKEAADKTDDELYHMDNEYEDFSAAIPLGNDVDASRFESEFDGNILTITLPKKPADRPQDFEDASGAI